jgi:hypothetical protein
MDVSYLLHFGRVHELAGVLLQQQTVDSKLVVCAPPVCIAQHLFAVCDGGAVCRESGNDEEENEGGWVCVLFAKVSKYKLLR